MNPFFETIKKRIRNNETLFYNSSGNTEAFKLGVKHLQSAEFLGFGDLHQNILYVRHDFTLVDFEQEKLTLILKGSKITLTPLEEL